jgi:hypothetical protein
MRTERPECQLQSEYEWHTEQSSLWHLSSAEDGIVIVTNQSYHLGDGGAGDDDDDNR